MPRTYVLYDVYDKLDELAIELGVKTAALLSYLLEEHSLSLGKENVHLVEDFEQLTLDFVRGVSVSRAAAYTAAERSAQLGIQIKSFTSFVIVDNLPALEMLPDSFPGVRQMQKAKDSRRGARSTTSSVSEDIYQWLRRRQSLLMGSVPISLIVSTILQSVPYQEIVETVVAEGFAEALMKEFPQSALHSIRLPYDIHEEINTLSQRLNIARWRLTSYFLKRDLEATTVEITSKRKLLPNNLRKRWAVLLKDFIELESEDDEV